MDGEGRIRSCGQCPFLVSGWRGAKGPQGLLLSLSFPSVVSFLSPPHLRILRQSHLFVAHRGTKAGPQIPWPPASCCMSQRRSPGHGSPLLPVLILSFVTLSKSFTILKAPVSTSVECRHLCSNLKITIWNLVGESIRHYTIKNISRLKQGHGLPSNPASAVDQLWGLGQVTDPACLCFCIC